MGAEGAAEAEVAAAGEEKEVVKKKKKEAEKEIKPPELSSYLKNFIKKEGESCEFKCRLEDEMEEGECKMSWFHNDEPLEASDKILISFDGTYATLFIAKCEMSHLGAYKVVFE